MGKLLPIENKTIGKLKIDKAEVDLITFTDSGDRILRSEGYVEFEYDLEDYRCPFIFLNNLLKIKFNGKNLKLKEKEQTFLSNEIRDGVRSIIHAQTFIETIVKTEQYQSFFYVVTGGIAISIIIQLLKALP